MNRFTMSAPDTKKKNRKTIVKTQTVDKVEWTFKREYADKYVGKEWKLTAKLKLNKFNTRTEYLWR